MATFFEGAYLGYWNSVENHFYGTLYGDVVRNGNTVTLTNMSLSVWTRYSSWGTMNFTMTINGTSTWFASAPSGSYGMNATSFSVSTGQTSANVGWYTSDGASGTFTVYFSSGVVAPTKPTVSAAVSSTSQNNVTYGTTSFGNPSSGTVYLYGGTSASPTTQLASKTTTGNSTYSHTGLAANTKYYYRSRASNGSANSDYSADATAVTKPATPSACSLTVTGETTATLSVTSPSQGSALSMTVYYKLNNGSYASMGTITQGGTITKTLTGLTAGTDYTATVYISTTSGNSGEKTSAQVKTWKKPQGVVASFSSCTSNSATLNVYLVSYGTPAAEVDRFIEGDVGPANGGTPYRYTKSDARATSATVTVDNSSPIYPSGSSMTISPNTQYSYRAYATNTKVDNASIWTNFVTLAAITSGTVDDITNSSATLTITIPAQGTANTITAKYRIKEGSGAWGSWIGDKTIAPNSSTSYTITGLKPNTEYTIEPNVNNTVGGTSAALVTFTTKPALYGSVNGQSKAIINLYGSVGGQTKRITKMYGSVNGVTKRLI